MTGVWAAVRGGHRDVLIPVVVAAWIPVTLLADAGASLAQQRLLGLVTWAILLLLLWGESPLVRAQTAVVIGFATVVEYTFSPLLEVYTYRLDNVPAFVPPGHGLVYLAAFALGRSRLFVDHARGLVTATVVLGGGYALWGLSPLAPRPDVLGAFWYVCLLGFLAWGRSRLLYVGAFVVVTYLEVVGTWVGTWTWSAYDPTGLVAMGNPPSGAAGGYGWFDLVALAVAPGLLRVMSRLRGRVRPRQPAPDNTRSDSSWSRPLELTALPPA
ncbi:MAG TPA: hypothetical protein VMW94_01425, partial [Actinomycetes bacterium]|nr:hypothetical protein [Actinomycetes bacterium]